MKKLLLLLLLVSSQVFASKANFCLEGYLVEIKSSKGVGSMSCEIEQNLKWQDSSALFQCSFGKNGEDSIYISSVGLGSDLNSTAWTDYSLNSRYDIGAFLQKGLGLSNVKKSQNIRILYSGNKLWNRDYNVIIETEDEIYKLYLQTNLGACPKFSNAL